MGANLIRFALFSVWFVLGPIKTSLPTVIKNGCIDSVSKVVAYRQLLQRKDIIGTKLGTRSSRCEIFGNISYLVFLYAQQFSYIFVNRIQMHIVPPPPYVCMMH